MARKADLCHGGLLQRRPVHYYWKTEYASESSDEFLSTMPELLAHRPIQGAELGVLHLGGSLNERDETTEPARTGTPTKRSG